MVKVLVIDDCKILDEAFSRADEPQVTYARTIQEGIHQLAIRTWDELYLDWALNPGCGQDILDWLADNLDRLPPKIVPFTGDSGKAEEIRRKVEVLWIMKKRFVKAVQDLLVVKKSTEPYRRVIWEQSPMNNNDEVVAYFQTQAEIDKFTQFLQARAFTPRDIRITTNRIVYKEEHLDFSYKGEKHKEGAPHLTLIIDAWTRLTNMSKFVVDNNLDPSKAIAMWIGTSYYDCMSGGMPWAEVALARILLQSSKVNLDEDVYPSDDRWLTLSDFLKDTRDYNDEEFRKTCRQLTALNIHPLLGEL